MQRSTFHHQAVTSLLSFSLLEGYFWNFSEHTDHVGGGSC